MLSLAVKHSVYFDLPRPNIRDCRNVPILQYLREVLHRFWRHFFVDFQKLVVKVGRFGNRGQANSKRELIGHSRLNLRNTYSYFVYFFGDGNSSLNEIIPPRKGLATHYVSKGCHVYGANIAKGFLRISDLIEACASINHQLNEILYYIVVVSVSKTVVLFKHAVSYALFAKEIVKPHFYVGGVESFNLLRQIENCDDRHKSSAPPTGRSSPFPNAGSSSGAAVTEDWVLRPAYQENHGHGSKQECRQAEDDYSGNRHLTKSSHSVAPPHLMVVP
jgi:hypothetical protein